MRVAIVKATVITALEGLITFLAVIGAVGLAFKTILGLARPTNYNVRGAHKKYTDVVRDFPAIRAFSCNIRNLI